MKLIVKGKTKSVYESTTKKGNKRYYQHTYSKYRRNNGTRKIISKKRIGLSQYKGVKKSIEAGRTREINVLRKRAEAMRKKYARKVPKEVEDKPEIRRISWGRTWFSRNEKTGQRYSIMTTYGYIFTTKGDAFNEGELHRDIITFENQHFMKGSSKTASGLIHDEDVYTIDNERYTGFESHIVDEDETTGLGLEKTKLVVVYYESGTSNVKWRKESVA